jgi:lysophospholipase L1-like esterase
MDPLSIDEVHLNRQGAEIIVDKLKVRIAELINN